jgi:hypothetical protein
MSQLKTKKIIAYCERLVEQLTWLPLFSACAVR